MPFGKPGADWLLLGPEVQLQHTDYNVSAAANRIRKTAYPQAEETACNLLQPPSEQEILQIFSKVELR